jgi:hypothetical protein
MIGHRALMDSVHLLTASRAASYIPCGRRSIQSSSPPLLSPSRANASTAAAIWLPDGKAPFPSVVDVIPPGGFQKVAFWYFDSHWKDRCPWRGELREPCLRRTQQKLRARRARPSRFAFSRKIVSYMRGNRYELLRRFKI